MHLETVGPGASYLVFDDPPSPELSRRIGAVAEALRSALPRGAFDVVPGYQDILVEGRTALSRARLLALAQEALDAPAARRMPRDFEIPVAYGAKADAVALADRLDMAWADIAALHAAGKYTVAYVGFTPGFPYLHGLDQRLRTPRRDRPRPDVPAGAVAMAGAQAGIYPHAGPGGWWVLGTTPFPLFMPERAEPTVLRAGDGVRFVAVEEGRGAPATLDQPVYPGGTDLPHVADVPARERPAGADRLVEPDRAVEPAPLVTVLEVWPGSASLQGRPRVGVGHYGLAEAGALDQRLLLALHLAVGAPLEQASIEFPVPHATLRAERATLAAFGGAATAAIHGRELAPGVPFEWRAGEELTLRPAAAGQRQRAGVPILSVAGGLAPLGGHAGHPLLAEGGSTDVRGRVGGFGRWLRPGDVLTCAARPAPPAARAPGAALGHYPVELGLHLYPGAHGGTAGFARLLSRTFVVGERSRMGVRLEPLGGGDALDLGVTGAEASRGMPLGAVQLPPDGRPLVLLADRGRTGGYPVLGAVARRDLAGLAQARAGTVVTFRAPRERGA